MICAGNGGRELHADFELRPIIEIGLRRRIGSAEQTHRRGGGRHGDIEGLAGGEAAKIGRRDLTLSVPMLAAAGVPLNVRVAALKVSQAGSGEPFAAVAV